jgi:hypothetical protein
VFASPNADVLRLVLKGTPALWYFSCSAGGNSSVVECDLAKVEVAGSNPVSRSTFFLAPQLLSLASKRHGMELLLAVRAAPNSYPFSSGVAATAIARTSGGTFRTCARWPVRVY